MNIVSSMMDASHVWQRKFAKLSNPAELNEIGERMGKYISIESYMRTQGISLREFADRCGIAPSTMSRFLSGKTDIQKSNIDKILKATDMSYEECFKEGLNEDKEN